MAEGEALVALFETKAERQTRESDAFVETLSLDQRRLFANLVLDHAGYDQADEGFPSLWDTFHGAIGRRMRTGSWLA